MIATCKSFRRQQWSLLVGNDSPPHRPHQVLPCEISPLLGCPRSRTLWNPSDPDQVPVWRLHDERNGTRTFQAQLFLGAVAYGKTTVVDEWSVIRLSTECCLGETVVCQSSGEYRVTCSWDVVILWLLYRKGKNVFEWMSRGRVKGTLRKKWPFYGSSTWLLYHRDIFLECPSNQVILIGIEDWSVKTLQGN
jgi:hypothetical protein